MIRGEKITLRLVRDTDLSTLFDLFSDLTVRGDYYPLHLFTEAQIKQRWQVWEEERGILSRRASRPGDLFTFACRSR